MAESPDGRPLTANPEDEDPRMYDEESEEVSAYGRRVGERLRSIRRQKRLSLQDVEATSSQEFKASVLGAYERGERAISVPRLERLADAVVAVEYYMETLQAGRADQWQMLDAAEARLAAMEPALPRVVSLRKMATSFCLPSASSATKPSLVTK